MPPGISEPGTTSTLPGTTSPSLPIGLICLFRSHPPTSAKTLTITPNSGSDFGLCSVRSWSQNPLPNSLYPWVPMTPRRNTLVFTFLVAHTHISASLCCPALLSMCLCRWWGWGGHPQSLAPAPQPCSLLRCQPFHPTLSSTDHGQFRALRPQACPQL